MQFTMVISRAMFVFKGIVNGKAQLQSVRFLSDDMMQVQNHVLTIKENDKVNFFLNGSAPVSRLSKEQFSCLAAAARFFGHLPGSSGKIQMWFCTTTMEMPYTAEPYGESLLAA